MLSGELSGRAADVLTLYMACLVQDMLPNEANEPCANEQARAEQS